MPALVSPIGLYQHSKNNMLIWIKTRTGNTVFYRMDEIPVDNMENTWFHMELDVDNDKATSTLFINGEIVEQFNNVSISLSGKIILGKGYLKRYWKGTIADLRISSIVRHVSNFQPKRSMVGRDNATLYVMDDTP